MESNTLATSSMVFSLPIFIFFLLALFIGLVLVNLLGIDIFLEEKISWALLLGIVLITVFTFVFPLIFGFTKNTIFLNLCSMSVLTFCIAILYRKKILSTFQKDIKIFSDRLFEGKLKFFLLFFIIFFLFFASLWSKVFYEDANNNIFTIGTAGVWGDWGAHSAYVSHFFAQDKISLEHPLFLGNKFSYTFMVDFLSATLMKMGADRIPAMVLPGFVFSILLVILLYYFIFRITKKESIAILAIILYLLGAGLGFYYFVQDVKSFDSFSDIATFMKNTTQEYTNINEQNIHFTAVINALLLPQRSFTMGFPLAILILSLLLMALGKKDNKLLVVAGLLASLLPTIHLHSLIALCIVGFFLIIFYDTAEKDKKAIFYRLLSFFSPIAIFAAPQVLTLFFPSKYHPKFQLFWLAKEENCFIFWLKNLGLYLILIIPAFLFAPKNLKKIYLCFSVLFILGNLILFQPHDYDNIKLMTFWFLLNAVLIANFLYEIWHKHILTKLLILIVFPFLIFSSFLDLAHLYLHSGYQIFSKEDLALAEFVKNKTSANSIFLTSDQHNHPIPALSGRQILIGYRGWLWTYGIDYTKREKDVRSMFSGGNKSKDLLKKYNINYVVIGPSEKNDYLANELFFKENFKIIYQNNQTKIYEISNL